MKQPPGMIQHELPCARCGYVLRGLPEDGRCPECAEAIATSLQGNLLRVSDPDWLRSLMRGTALCTWGVRLVFIMFFVYVLTLLVTGWFYPPPPPPGQQITAPIAPTLNTIIFIAFGLWLLTPIIIGIGLWMIMKPEPRESELSEAALAGRCALAGIVVPALGIWFLLSHHALPLSLPVVVHVALIHLFAGVTIAQSWTLRDRLTELSGRFAHPPRLGYSASVGWRRWGFLVIPGLCLALYWTGPLRSLSPPAGGWTMPTAESDRLFFYAIGLYWLIVVAVVGRYRTAIRHEFEQMQRNDAADEVANR